MYDSAMQRKAGIDIFHQCVTQRSLCFRFSLAYEIHIETGEQRMAETEYDVWIQLVGSKRKTKEFIFENSAEDPVFQRGQVDRFQVESEDVEDIKQIQIGHKTQKQLPDYFDAESRQYNWYCKRIGVKDLETKRTYVFTVNSWLPLSRTGRDGFEIDCDK